jgi:hypothetical protein
MNPLQLLMLALQSKGLADPFSGSHSDDLVALTKELKAAQENKKGGTNPLDRLKDAFSQLKDMHKDDPAAIGDSTSGASPFDNAQWPYGPVGAPSQAQASAPAPAPQAPAPVPMPAPRPAAAAQAPASNPFADFFARNTAMMKDPVTGEFIDPQAAAKYGGSGILNGLFK